MPVDGADAGLRELVGKLDRPECRSVIRLYQALEESVSTIAGSLRKKFPGNFGTVDEAPLLRALNVYIGHEEAVIPDGTEVSGVGELDIRLPEYAQLSKEHFVGAENKYLVTRMADRGKFPLWLKDKLDNVCMVDRLMETRVFGGFSRLLPNLPEGASGGQSLLWANFPQNRDDRWLPAVQVFGEGIFIKLSESPLQEWERREDIRAHIDPLLARYERVLRASRRERQEVSPRLILLHTLSHLMIRRLIFDCGYGSASLRERLYVSQDPDNPMAGILIYTASGDCEGSMGGLVRMGEPENLSGVLSAALEDAQWCPSDPVCAEIGRDGGQGSDGMNIAACHSCALLPETSCELFNQFLDRDVVNGYFGL
jgi:hypothetical protein